jgi:hypothetical protein
VLGKSPTNAAAYANYAINTSYHTHKYIKVLHTHTHTYIHTHTQVLGMDPTNAAAYANYATLLWEDRRNISASAELFRSAINLCTHREERAPLLTTYAVLIENHSPAELLNDPSAGGEGDAFEWKDLGVCGCTGDTIDDLAEAVYREAVASDPLYAPAMYNLAVFLFEVVDK